MVYRETRAVQSLLTAECLSSFTQQVSHGLGEKLKQQRTIEKRILGLYYLLFKMTLLLSRSGIIFINGNRSSFSFCIRQQSQRQQMFIFIIFFFSILIIKIHSHEIVTPKRPDNGHTQFYFDGISSFEI